MPRLTAFQLRRFYNSLWRRRARNAVVKRVKYRMRKGRNRVAATQPR